MGSSVKKSQLSALRKLVDNLSDRDVKIKRDMRLFEEFFANFPIAVSIWSLTSEGTVISQRGNGLICPGAACVNTLFESFEEKDKYVKVHREALKGKSFQGTAFHNNKTFYIAVAPRRDENENVSGAIGLAWDVTPNQNILSNLEKILDVCKDSDEERLDQVEKFASDALESSRLYKLINKKGD